jgi:hypothetical protein
MTVSLEPERPAGAAGPVTATVTRRVKPGHEAAYEEFLAGISGAAKAFPGYLGEEVLTVLIDVRLDPEMAPRPSSPDPRDAPKLPQVGHRGTPGHAGWRVCYVQTRRGGLIGGHG